MQKPVQTSFDLTAPPSQRAVNASRRADGERLTQSGRTRPLIGCDQRRRHSENPSDTWASSKLTRVWTGGGNTAALHLEQQGCMMGSFRRPRPRFMSSPVLSDLARFHASSPALQLSNTSVWNSQSSSARALQPELFNLSSPTRALQPELSNLSSSARALQPELSNQSSPIRALQPELFNLSSPTRALQPELFSQSSPT
ncbi:Proline-rich protein 5-like [Collichthys lucidus]|uniref:Proline-rich protein 5-like n=1 Tax=Collichthys lucidus TaxID=240159 RepID=A0A4U5UFM2_COLLU|nr:Proline-rich protein 5-like [Collichthys lucidus]